MFYRNILYTKTKLCTYVKNVFKWSACQKNWFNSISYRALLYNQLIFFSWKCRHRIEVLANIWGLDRFRSLSPRRACRRNLRRSWFRSRRRWWTQRFRGGRRRGRRTRSKWRSGRRRRWERWRRWSIGRKEWGRWRRRWWSRWRWGAGRGGIWGKPVRWGWRWWCTGFWRKRNVRIGGERWGWRRQWWWTRSWWRWTGVGKYWKWGR